VVFVSCCEVFSCVTTSLWGLLVFWLWLRLGLSVGCASCHKLLGSGFAVFCFFSVCRCKKPYVDDINLDTEQVDMFWVLADFRFGFWLSLP